MWTAGGLLWTFWGVNAVLSFVYCIFSSSSFKNVNHLYTKLDEVANEDLKSARVAMLGILASYLLSMGLAALYNITSFFILLRQHFSRMVLTGFRHGALLTGAIYTSAFMLLSGFTLHVHELLMKQGLGNAQVNTYQATYMFAYVLTGTYFVVFLSFILCKSASSGKRLQG